MTSKRRYDDGCATAHALELVGERWALLVVRELLLGPKRFTDLRHDLPGLSPNVLSQRLSELEEASLVIRRKLPPPAPVTVYELTKWGYELEPLVREFGRWAARSPSLAGGRPMSVNSLVLSLRTMFNAEAAKGFRGRISLKLGAHEFGATVGQGRIAVDPGAMTQHDVELSGDPNALAQVIYGGKTLDEAVKKGSIALSGDRRVAARFVKLFPLPARAPDLSKEVQVR
jgi:DNA-binding HxlR family transcriptional regulator